MDRHATDVNLLTFSVAMLSKRSYRMKLAYWAKYVPTPGCQPGGLIMHLWFKWINGLSLE